jgi:hypothetical protein
VFIYKLVNKYFIFKNLYLKFIFIKPRGIKKLNKMLNTKVKCNIIFKKLIRKLRIVIYNIKDLKIIIINKYNFSFINITII